MRAAHLLSLVALVLVACSVHCAEHKPHKRALLAADTELTTDATVDGGRRLLCFAGNCVRPLSRTQSHKTPTAPKMTRKTFNTGPKKALLAVEAELSVETLAESCRRLLCFAGNCVRPLSKTQSHKTPTAPKITRKIFNEGPKKALLAARTGNCVRPLSKTQGHKTPIGPKLSRKSFTQNFPKRA